MKGGINRIDEELCTGCGCVLIVAQWMSSGWIRFVRKRFVAFEGDCATARCVRWTVQPRPSVYHSTVQGF